MVYDYPDNKILFNTGMCEIEIANLNAPPFDEVYSIESPTGYTRVKVKEVLGRLSPKLTIQNFGLLEQQVMVGGLFIIYSANAESFSGNEIYLPPPINNGDYTWVEIYNVYEIRLRSDVAAVPYQIGEFRFK